MLIMTISNSPAPDFACSEARGRLPRNTPAHSGGAAGACNSRMLDQHCMCLLLVPKVPRRHCSVADPQVCATCCPHLVGLLVSSPS